jgi:hypothetical protein
LGKYRSDGVVEDMGPDAAAAFNSIRAAVWNKPTRLVGAILAAFPDRGTGGDGYQQ